MNSNNYYPRVYIAYCIILPNLPIFSGIIQVTYSILLESSSGSKHPYRWFADLVMMVNLVFVSRILPLKDWILWLLMHLFCLMMLINMFTAQTMCLVNNCGWSSLFSFSPRIFFNFLLLKNNYSFC